MGAAQNIELIKNYFADRARGDVDAALARVTEDVTHSFMFEMPGAPSVWKGKQGLKDFAAHVKKMLPNGSTMDVQKWHATDDAVIMEAIGSGKAHNGNDYRNKYCFIFDIKDGKIAAIREYTDSHYSRTTLIGP
jgi:ketosteroid isomerase-like protein